MRTENQVKQGINIPGPEIIPGISAPEIPQPSDPYRQGITPEIPVYHNVEIPQRVPEVNRPAEK